MSDLKATFDEAVNYVATAEGSFKPSQELKLTMYALVKQASEGDVKGKKPAMLDVVGRFPPSVDAACLPCPFWPA